MNNLPNHSSGLSFKALLIGAIGSAFIAASSVYVALRLSALPWTILFAVVLSYNLIISPKKGTLHEVNIAHTAMTSGSMTAASVAFIIPAWWRLYPESYLSPFLMMLAMLVAIIIALSYTYSLRHLLINTLALPFPIGKSAYDTIMACQEGGSKSRYLFSAGTITALFTLLRDKLNFIPQTLVNNSYGRISTSPMTVAMGYILGPKFSLTWALSGWLTLFLLIPLAIHLNLIESWQKAKELQNQLGVGLLIGASLGTLLKLLVKYFRSAKTVRSNFPKRAWPSHRFIIYALGVALLLMLFAIKLPWQSSFFLLPVSFIAAILVALLVGQGGLNPLEVVGAMAFLVVSLVHLLSPLQALIITLIATTVCALTGDMMNDFKAGSLLNTSPLAMLISDALGAIIGMVVSVATLFAIKSSFNLFTPDSLFTAAQSNAIATVLSHQVISLPIIIAIAIAILIAITPVSAIAVALGFYLAGYGLGSLVALGGLIALITQHYGKNDEGKLISAGILAGEGLMGSALAFLMMLKL